MLESDRRWTVNGRKYPMVSDSRLDKDEQPANVAIHNPTTTPEAARNRKDRRAGSIICTIILIQKSIQ
jgi:hypothetical protein